MIQATTDVPGELLQELVRTSCPICSCEASDPEQVVAGHDLEKCQDCGLVYMNPRCTADQRL